MPSPVSSSGFSQPVQSPAAQLSVSRRGISDIPSTLQSGCGVGGVFNWIGNKLSQAWNGMTGLVLWFYQRIILRMPTTLDERLARGRQEISILLDILKAELIPNQTRVIVLGTYHGEKDSSTSSLSNPDLFKSVSGASNSPSAVVNYVLCGDVSVGIANGILNLRVFGVQNNQNGTFSWRCPEARVNFATSLDDINVVNRGDNVALEQLQQRFQSLIPLDPQESTQTLAYLTQ